MTHQPNEKESEVLAWVERAQQGVDRIFLAECIHWESTQYKAACEVSIQWVSI